MKRKVCHLTTVHGPFDVRIFHKECQTLSKAGYEVVLIVPHSRDEVVGGVQIRGMPRSKGRLKRMTWDTWRAYQRAIAEDADPYHFHDPELIPVGLLLKLRGKRVLYDAHEDVPRQVLGKYWMPRLLRRPMSWLIERLEAMGTRLFDGVVAATPAIARRFAAHKTVTVQNFPLLDEGAMPQAQPYNERAPLVVYIGGIAISRGAREMIQAMRLLPPSLGARLVLAGKFSPTGLEGELEQIDGWESVDSRGWLSRKRVMDLLAKARVGLVLFHPGPNHLESQPNKLFEYISAGLPVVASDFPLWRGLVEQERCGILVDPLDAQAIARALLWLLEHPEEAEAMGERGREAVRRRYNWDAEAQKLLSLYQSLLAS